ncbi:MAG: GTPase [Verrucomicrobiota bacterium]
MKKGGEDKKEEVVFSLISHTNVGKTALARTLLREDVGEVADSAHVTVVPESYLLIEEGEESARLWDTPGFGANLAKLAKRLRSSENPVGWILHQVWDRHADKSLWCSQEAVRNVQAESDVVFYLVDASQSPESLGYIDLELDVIEWIGKPVIVFLNQSGQASPEKRKIVEREWRERLAKHEVVRHLATLDAFTRCWTEEHHLFELASDVLEGSKKKVARNLAQAWERRSLETFHEAMGIMGAWASKTLADTEPLGSQGLLDRFKLLLSRSTRDRELDRIQEAMYERLAKDTSKTVNELIALHGLDGETASELASTSKEEFLVKRDLEEPLAATIGGAVSGLVGGLSADLISGGMTFGGGAIVGMLLGGTTTYALAKGYNLTRTDQNLVRWNEGHFLGQVKFLVMLYLAISHYGRGRGIWQDPVNNPGHWEERLDSSLEAAAASWKALWKKGGAKSDRNELGRKATREFTGLIGSVLGDLYPDSVELFRRS